MNGWGWLLICYFILWSIVTVLSIGRPVETMTNNIALMRLFVAAGLIASVLAATRVI